LVPQSRSQRWLHAIKTSPLPHLHTYWQFQ
jgi:hypothetical protein